MSDNERGVAATSEEGSGGENASTAAELLADLDTRATEQAAPVSPAESRAPAHEEPALTRTARARAHLAAQSAVISDRSARAYELAFGSEIMSPGGRVLDLGAGDSTYAQTLNSEGSLKVIRLDENYARDRPGHATGAVAGIAQELPFADKSFKYVVASSMTEYLPPSQAKLVLREALRVTEDDGSVMICPIVRPRKLARKLKRIPPFVHIEGVKGLRGAPPVYTLKIEKRADTSDEDLGKALDLVAPAITYSWLGQKMHARQARHATSAGRHLDRNQGT